MKDFTASNGVRVRRINDWTVDVEATFERYGVAIREFLRAEEDERLGRWRWPESPQWVLYPDEDGGVVALDESTGESTSTLSRLTVSAFPDAWGCPAARAYFDAHPGSKPWHDAKPGEVWLLTVDGERNVPAVASSSEFGGTLFTAATNDAGGTEEVWSDSPRITVGRRIYPEGEN